MSSYYTVHMLKRMFRGSPRDRRRALEQVLSGPPSTLESLLSGVRIDESGVIQWPLGAGGDWFTELATPQHTTLAMLRAAGRLDGVERLDLTRSAMPDLAPLEGLTGLRRLNLRQGILVDLSALDTLTGLERLDLGKNPARNLPDLSPLIALRSLRLDGSWLESLAPIAGCVALEQLDVGDSERLRDISALAGLTALESLRIASCPLVDDLSPIRELQGLVADVSIDERGRLCRPGPRRSLTPVQGHELFVLLHVDGPHRADIREIALTGSPEVRDLDFLADLAGLERLDLTRCSQLADASALLALTALQQLELAGCGALRPRPGQALLSTAEGVTGYRGKVARSLKRRAGRTPLQETWLQAATDQGLLKRAAPSSAQKELKQALRQIRRLLAARELPDVRLGAELLLTLEDPSLANELARGITIDPLGLVRIDETARRRSHLKRTASRGPVLLAVLRAAGRLDGVEQLFLQNARGLIDVSALDGLEGLRSLRLHRVWEMTEAPDLTGLPGLREFELAGAQALVDLTPLQQRPELERLGLDSHSLTDLSPLILLPALRHLALRGCTSVTDLSPLRAMRGLESLEIHWSPRLRDLSPIAALPALRRVEFSMCGSLPQGAEGRYEGREKVALLQERIAAP